MSFEPRAVVGIMSAIEAFRADVEEKDSEINEDEGDAYETNRNVGHVVENAGSSARRTSHNVTALHHGADAAATKAVDLYFNRISIRESIHRGLTLSRYSTAVGSRRW